MPSFLTAEQQALAREIARLLTEREQTGAVVEGTAGGPILEAVSKPKLLARLRSK